MCMIFKWTPSVKVFRLFKSRCNFKRYKIKNLLFVKVLSLSKFSTKSFIKKKALVILFRNIILYKKEVFYCEIN